MAYKRMLVLMLIIAFIAVPIFAAIPVQAIPTTWYVSTAGIDGLPNDGSLAKPWRTIQYAVNHAAAGDTIIVAPGVYDEAVNIGILLTLTGQLGAVIQPDNTTPLYDGGVRRAAVYITANGVTVQGFEIDGTHDTVHYGIYGFNTNGLTIQNNKIHDMSNDASDVAGVGIILFGWGAAVNDNLITNNVVYNTARMGIGVTAMQSSSPWNWLICSGTTISWNVVYNTWQGPTNDGGGGIQVNGAKNTVINDNQVHDTKTAGSSWLKTGIYVYGSDAGNSITCNDVYNNKYGIVTWIDAGGGVVGLVATTPATHNNNIYYNTGYGVYNIPGPITLDAKSNWWGSTNGPGTVGSGSGDHVNAGVDFSSYLNAPAPCAPHFTLTVYSDHDSPSPPVGANIEPPGWIVTASLSTSTVPGPTGTQYVSTGWTGTGDVTALTFTVTRDSSITWNWKTQYYLTVTSAYDTPTGQGWYDAGSVVTASVAPSVGHELATGWTGTGSAPPTGNGPTVTFTINQPSSVTFNWQYTVVGGEWGPITLQAATPVNTLQLMAPWITLALLAAASAFAVYRRFLKKRL